MRDQTSMFDVLRKRIHSVLGTNVVSLSELDSIDVDSVDSICISDKSSSPVNPLNGTDDAASSSGLDEDRAYKQKVLRIAKSLKALERRHQQKQEGKMSIMVFMDMIRDQEYRHVSMCMLNDFLRSCHMVPKAYYLHYYVFFMYYAIYYHSMRGAIDVIDEKMKPQHLQHLSLIKKQLKYLQYIIKESRTHSVSNDG